MGRYDEDIDDFEQAAASLSAPLDKKDNKKSQKKGKPQEEDIKPVKMSKKSVGILLIVLVFLAFFIFLAWDKLAIFKKSGGLEDSINGGNQVNVEVPENLSGNDSNNNQNYGNNQDASSVSQQTGNSGIYTNQNNHTADYSNQGTNVNQNPPVVDVSIATPVPQITSPDSTQQSATFETIPLEPQWGSVVKTSGIITGTSIYRIGNSYTYGINILIVTGNATSIECSYFCPRKTYDALSVGDALIVTYQADSQGNVSIVSIEKQ